MKDFWDTPIADRIYELQDRMNIWIAGFNERGYALIVDADGGRVSSAHVDSTSGLGRWECSKEHYEYNSELYAERYPIR